MIFALIALSLSHKSFFNHFCNHDAIQRKTKVHTISLETTRSKSTNKKTLSNEREPIRINLDFRIDKDEYQCIEEGQEVIWQDTLFQCESIDIANETQKSALQGTMENVKNYLQSILLVDRTESPIDLITYIPSHFNLTDCPNSVSNTDIFLSVFIRTYGESQTLASAHYITLDEETSRPVQGAIYVNSRYLPSEIQNEDSINTNFFYTVIHEIMHALGISSDSFPYYHPKDTNTPYENPLVSLYDKTTGKNHTFLVTPYSHKFAVKQWGYENFTIDGESVPSGIEIEDGGGEGTAGSHPECRIGNQDLMVGVSLQGEVGSYNRFTPLTAAILLDTGNYDIVWDKIQPLVWGNKESIDGNYIEDFVTGPPSKVFPQQYIYRPKTDPSYDRCGFTFKMLGGLNMINITESPVYNCSLEEWKNYANTKAYCESEKFFNPNKEDVIGGDWSFDFQIVHFPSLEICGVGNACIAGMWNCAPYKIADDEKSFTIVINGTDVECNESNAGKIFDTVGKFRFSFGFKCPPVEQFIRTVRMMENQPYVNGNPFEEEVQNPSSSEISAESFESTIVDEESSISSDENHPISSSDEENEASTSKEDQIVSSSNEEQIVSSSKEDQIVSSSNEENEVSSSKEDQIISSSYEEQITTSSDEDQSEPPIFVPPLIPSINDSYTLESSNITFTENGYKDSEGNENKVSNSEDDILLIKTDQPFVTITSSNANRTNLFLSPQTDNSYIKIQKDESSGNVGEIGIHASSSKINIELPNTTTPLSLFSDKESKINLNVTSEDDLEPVLISLSKLTMNEGKLEIEIPNGTTGVEFDEIEIYQNSKLETYQNGQLAETSINKLNMRSGSRIEMNNVSFKERIECEGGSIMNITGLAKFNSQTTLILSDTSFINFGKSIIEGICKEIIIKEPTPNLKKLDSEDENKDDSSFSQSDDENSEIISQTNEDEDEEEEINATIICGSNFDCSSWKNKYSKNSTQYPYAKCVSNDNNNDDDDNEKCLVVTNKLQEKPEKKKGLKKGAIIGIVVACVVVVLIIVIIIVVLIKKRKKDVLSSVDGENYEESVGL